MEQKAGLVDVNRAECYSVFYLELAMKFGRPANIDRVDKSEIGLPLEPASNEQVLKTSHSKNLPARRFSIGLPIWAKKEFAGELYPKSTASKDYLRYYSKVFNSVELNSTFYSLPSTERLEIWKQSVPKDFRFYAKAPKVVGHSLGTKESILALKDFSIFLEQLEGHRGTAFIQFPESFHPGSFDLLCKLIRSLPREFSFAIELRHLQWFTNKSLWSQLCRHLHQFGVGLVITDALGRRDCCHMQLSSPFSMVRFLANSLHTSDFERLETWVEKIEEWMKAGIEDAALFLHQPNEVDCIPLVKHLESWRPDLLQLPKQTKQLSLV